MRIGFVCTNYNNSSFTRAAIASLYAGTRPDDVRIVVVDNQSNRDDLASLQAMGREYPGVDLVLNPDNVGYFPGLNIGINRLRTRFPDIEHVVVGNNDLQFPVDFVESIQRYRDIFESRPVVAPDIVRPDGLHQNPHVLHPISAARRLVWELYYTSYAAAFVVKRAARLSQRYTARRETLVGHTFHETPREIVLGFGACYILGSAFFRNFARLYAPTFLMQEEFFLAEQLRSIDEAVYYDPRFVVFHHDHATTDRMPSRHVWKLSRDAHLVYKRFLAMSLDERRAVIAAATRG